MAEQLHIPMTRATGFGPLPEMLERQESGVALRRAFSAGGVSLETLEHRQEFVPLASMMKIFELAGRAVGDRMFGLEVGRAMTPASFGLWLQYSASAPDLAAGLKRAVRTAQFQQSGGVLSAERRGEEAIWSYHPPHVDVACRQHSDHTLWPMIRFAAAFLGETWRPSWVAVNYPKDRLADDLERRLGAPLIFGQDRISVAFPATLLTMPNRRDLRRETTTLTYFDVAAAAAGARPQDLTGSLLGIVGMRLLDGRTDIDGAARLAGISARTLQRRLRDNNLSYRNLVDIAKLKRAKALLAETDQTITEIAFALGYSDHANFTRAFRRAEGLPPSDFRLIHADSQPG